MFTEMFYKLSKCVCEFWTECSPQNVCLSKCASPLSHYTAWDPIDGPKDHLSRTR
uniref:Uncharacterized protein n=1 Tax=Helianthus annuus TaxID=4232 RepID=A0A251UEU8_HELAN